MSPACCPGLPFAACRATDRGYAQEAPFRAAADGMLAPTHGFLCKPLPLTYFSDSDRTSAYRALQGIEGCEQLHGPSNCHPAENGSSVITMPALISAQALRAPDIANGARAMFDISISAVAQTAQAPAQKAFAPAKSALITGVADMIIDTRPGLAIFVTPNKQAPLVCFCTGLGVAGPTGKSSCAQRAAKPRRHCHQQPK